MIDDDDWLMIDEEKEEEEDMYSESKMSRGIQYDSVAEVHDHVSGWGQEVIEGDRQEWRRSPIRGATTHWRGQFIIDDLGMLFPY